MNLCFKATNNLKNIKYTCDQNEISMVKVNQNGEFEKSTFSVGSDCYNSILSILSFNEQKTEDLILKEIETTIEKVKPIIEEYDKIETTEDIKKMNNDVRLKSSINIFYVSETGIFGIEMDSEKNYASKHFYSILKTENTTPLELVNKIITYSKSVVPEKMIETISVNDSSNKTVYEYDCSKNSLKVGFSEDIKANEHERKDFLTLDFNYEEKRVNANEIPYKYSFEKGTIKDINLGYDFGIKVDLDELMANYEEVKCEVNTDLDDNIEFADIDF